MRSRAGATLPALRRSLRRKAPARHLSGSDAGAFRSPTTPQERASEKISFIKRRQLFPNRRCGAFAPNGRPHFRNRSFGPGAARNWRTIPASLVPGPFPGAAFGRLVCGIFACAPAFSYCLVSALHESAIPRSILRPRHIRPRVIPARLRPHAPRTFSHGCLTRPPREAAFSPHRSAPLLCTGA